MKISELGEFGLIERIAAKIGTPKNKVIVGVGDDAAIVAGSDKPVVLTTDMLVEDVHFIIEEIPPHAIGYKSVAVNISDVAAVAGYPKYALVSLGLKSSLSMDFLDELYRGMLECAGKYDVDIVGGDITKTPVLIINLVIVGEVEENKIRRRDQAVSGDIILVTGNLGASAAGLKIIKTGLGGEMYEKLVKAHFYPPARVNEAQVAAAMGCRAMEDISDGLGRELANICRASHVGAKIWIDKIPAAAEVVEVAEATGLNPIELAISGGEDYELVMTAAPEKVEALIDAVYRKTGTQVSAIGEITPGDGVKFYDREDHEYYPQKIGYEHFK